MTGDADIDRTDAHFRRCAPGSEDEAAWLRLRGELRRRRSQSSTALRAVGAVASGTSHFVKAREEIEAGLAEIGSAHVPPEDA